MRSLQRQLLAERLEEARDKLFRAMRQCAWCSYKAPNSSDELVAHIEQMHPRNPTTRERQ